MEPRRAGEHNHGCAFVKSDGSKLCACDRRPGILYGDRDKAGCSKIFLPKPVAGRKKAPAGRCAVEKSA